MRNESISAQLSNDTGQYLGYPWSSLKSLTAALGLWLRSVQKKILYSPC